MQIDGKTKTCGLIGDPVAHTLSPVIHNTLAQTRGDDLVYVPLRVEAEQVRKAVEGAYALSLTGLNVTVPHKSAVIPYLVDIDPLAEKIGAVNTLVRQEGGFKGYNTDIGIIAHRILYRVFSFSVENSLRSRLVIRHS